MVNTSSKKICIVGCGAIARVHAKHLREKAELHFVSRRRESAEALCSEFGGTTVYDNYEQAVQAAIDGQGVALVGSVLVADDIAAGRLVRPFELSFPVNFAYYVVRPKGYDERAKVGAFISWLMDEAKEHNVALAGEPSVSIKDTEPA